MAEFIGLTRKQYEGEARDFIVLAEHYLEKGDLKEAENFIKAALGALKCARKATR